MKKNLQAQAMNGRDPAKAKSNPFDFYPTPRSAVLDLVSIAELPAGSVIMEPCAGDGAIVGVLEDGANAMAFAWFKFVRIRNSSPTVHWIPRPSVSTVALATA